MLSHRLIGAKRYKLRERRVGSTKRIRKRFAKDRTLLRKKFGYDDMSEI
jgi:hypothetical protein